MRSWVEQMAAHAADPGSGPEPQKPAEPLLRPWIGEPVWCGRCATGIHRELSELDDLIAMLLAVPDLRGDPGQAGKVSGTRGHRSPSPYADDADELAGWARAWESAVRGTDPAPRRGYLASELTATLGWLTAHFEPLIANADLAEDFGSEIRAWHKTLAAKGRAGTGKHHKGRPCPRCTLYTLWWEEGADYVTCANIDCQRLLSLTEYDDLAEDKVFRTTRR
jgi:hypothetical protein